MRVQIQQTAEGVEAAPGHGVTGDDILTERMFVELVAGRDDRNLPGRDILGTHPHL
ncbi:hypothetical protein ACLMAJ_35285 [Nocardia sp. KC 131]|uniref:hypothetical protein n=1 Tax=Nocardia arseniciresistens TaxID=3392119 RepID=UPI00398E890D